MDVHHEKGSGVHHEKRNGLGKIGQQWIFCLTKKRYSVSHLLVVIGTFVTYMTIRSWYCNGAIQPSCCSDQINIPGLLTNWTKPTYHFESNKPVPKMVHFCWYGGLRRTNFRFYHLISVLSAYKHIKPSVIYFWYDYIPQGALWRDVLKRVPIMKLKHRPAPTHTYHRSLGRYDQHQSDVVRLEVLMEFGGIYMDLDVVALKSFDPLLEFDTTMGYEDRNRLCNGIIISKPNAPFLRLWHLEYATFDDNSWAFHSVELPAILAETYPRIIHTEERSLHRPNWKEWRWMYKTGMLYDWSKNFAVHLFYIHTLGLTEHSPESIKKLDTTMGQIFRYIYYGSKEFVQD
ncbi:uncharacterized protein LOC135502432 isoform X2 [Lineus longissimus]|uniref:uncharacterized protein LOC135502432 isoform X2 n=1 Tax=Lineus longissimus TaxID=88925 RepID=UPI00315C7A34